LISEFLDFVKPEKIKLKPLSLDDLLSEVVAVASGMREIKEIATISTRFEKVSVLAHEEKLKQVVWNLLLNSVQALSQPGKIEIGCEALNAQRVKWWISDTGQGMTEEVLAHIYEPFFTTKPKGTGLGLPTVYKIIEAHHGEIKVNSTYGKGTCFEIYIPRS
jgi:two-component system sensor histidine kinase PilS (NtrC family)